MLSWNRLTQAAGIRDNLIDRSESSGRALRDPHQTLMPVSAFLKMQREREVAY
jgi:hypothetical protein